MADIICHLKPSPQAEILFFISHFWEGFSKIEVVKIKSLKTFEIFSLSIMFVQKVHILNEIRLELENFYS